MATTIVLVRHGETDWNRERRFQGHADVPLNDGGRSQVRALAAELAGERFAAAYTSPLRRAAESAAILATALDLDVRTSDALREVDVGSWCGLTVAEVEASDPRGYRRWLHHGHGWEGGESYEELGARVVAGLFAIGERHAGDTVLAVTHGGPIRSVLAASAGASFANAPRLPGGIANCATIRVTVQEGSVRRVE